MVITLLVLSTAKIYQKSNCFDLSLGALKIKYTMNIKLTPILDKITGSVILVGIIAACSLCCFPAFGQESEAPIEKSFKKTITKNYELGYLLNLPKDFSDKTKKRWPLILFLHGAGERGNDLQKVAVHGPPKLASQKSYLSPFIVISPQCPEGERWDPDILIHFVDYIAEEYPVDKKRIYLTGLSMGGYGTWALVSKYPQIFAAAAPICGGGNPINIKLSKPAAKKAIAQLPVWNFHGLKDTVVPPQRSDVMVQAMMEIGGNIRYTRYPEAHHDSWTATYSNADLYEWFLSHSK